jgi:hypothetical protein
MNGLHLVEHGSIYTLPTVCGKDVTFDEEGFLVDPDLWNKRLAELEPVNTYCAEYLDNDVPNWCI